jgi:hypothetical protein
MKKVFLFSIIFSGLLIFIIKTNAETSSLPLLFTELMYNPSGADDGKQWVEIYNQSTSTPYVINDTWRFFDTTNHKLTVVQGDNTLLPNEYGIIAEDAVLFLQNYPSYSGHLWDTIMSLNNTQQNLFLFSDNAQKMAGVFYSATWGGADNDKTLEKIDLTGADEQINWQESLTIGGTPGEAYKIETIATTTVESETLSDTATTTIEVEDEYLATTTATTTEEIVSTTTENIISTTTVQTLIKINEIFPNPIGDDTSDEFIELYNSGESEIDLTGWKLSDATTRKYVLTSDDFPDLKLEPKSYLVIYRQESGIALNNTGDSVKLYQADDTLFAEVIYTEAKEGQSWARKEDNTFVWTEKVTAGRENLFFITEPEPTRTTTVTYTSQNVNYVTATTITPTTTINFNLADYQNLRINEIFPNPDGVDDNEWIELYNNSSSTISLVNLKLDDGIGGSKPYSFSSTSSIPAFGYSLLKKSDTKLNLNNTGDSIRLLGPQDQVIAEVVFPKASSGEAYIYSEKNDDWFWSKNFTEQAKNIEEVDEEEIVSEVKTATAKEETNLDEEFPLVSFAEFKELPSNKKVSLIGQVAQQAKSSKNKFIYLAEINLDSEKPILGSGLQIYSSGFDWSSLKLGEVIKVSGKVSVLKIQTRLNLAIDLPPEVIKKLSAPLPLKISLGDLSEDYLGSLIEVSGQVTERKGNYLYLGDDSGEIRVYSSDKELFKSLPPKTGYDLTASGILEMTTAGFRLVPRFVQDLKATQVLGVVEEASENPISTTTINIADTNRADKPLKNLMVVGGAAAILGIIWKLRMLFV